MVTWFVGNSSENSDGIPTTVTVISFNRNVVGNSSEFSDDFSTTTMVIFFIGMSLKYSDDPCFLGNSSELADGIPTTLNFLFSSEIGRKSVQKVRRLWRPSESPSEFGVFSCSDKLA